MSKATDEIVDAANPVPYMRGRFNLFHTPGGGLHIAYQEDGKEEIQHIDIPGQVVRAAEMMSKGEMKPGQVLKMFTGMMR
jgi:hypothetical protein